MKKGFIDFIKLFIFFIGWAVTIALIPSISFKDSAMIRLWLELTPLLVLVLYTYLFIKFIEKDNIKFIIFGKYDVINRLKALLVGLLWIGSTTLILLILGIIDFKSINNIPNLWIWIIAVFLNVIMQELLVRGYLYQLFKKDFNVVVATIITTLLFTLMHGGAFEAGIIAVLNVVTMSIFMSLVLEYTNSLTAPIIIHFIWNVIGGLFLGSISLADDYPHLLNTSFTGNTLLSGGIYKMEGSIVVLIVNILLIITYAYLIIIKRKLSNNK